MRTPAVELAGLTKNWGGRRILDMVDLSVRQGEFVCIVGASGSGKSTLLDLIAGLEAPDSGSVSAKPAAVMFQEPALFPWLSVSANIDLALKLARVPRALRPGRIAALLAMVRLEGSGEHAVHQLSGGMRQRAALARALAQDRDLLLMDEPFSAVDAITRLLLQQELRQLWQDSGCSIVLVTHSVDEAVRLGQRVVLLASNPGRVAAAWTVDDGVRQDPAQAALLMADITARLQQEVTADARIRSEQSPAIA